MNPSTNQSIDSACSAFSAEDHQTWSIFFHEIEKMFLKFGELVHPFYRDNFSCLWHLPSLLSPDYRKLLASWSKEASTEPVGQVDLAHYHLNKLITQSQDNISGVTLEYLTTAAKLVDYFIKASPSSMHVFDKTYFWIFEFGVIEHLGQRKILGAGLLSSLSEFSKFALGIIETRPLNLDTILAPTNISSIQNEYLVVDNVSQYFDVINAVTESTSTTVPNHEVRHAIQ